MAHWELDDAADAAFIDGLRRRNSSCKLKGSDRWSNSTSKVDISFALVGIEMIAGRRSIQALNATFVGGHVSFQRVPNDGRIMLKPTRCSNEFDVIRCRGSCSILLRLQVR